MTVHLGGALDGALDTSEVAFDVVSAKPWATIGAVGGAGGGLWLRGTQDGSGALLGVEGRW